MPEHSDAEVTCEWMEPKPAVTDIIGVAAKDQVLRGDKPRG